VELNYKGGYMERNALTWVTIVLVVIGAINWGLVGAFGGFNLVEKLFGSVAWLENTIYVLVGLSGIVELGLLFK
jgi:uncharacterized protein